jgi:hypothetical protein
VRLRISGCSPIRPAQSELTGPKRLNKTQTSGTIKLEFEGWAHHRLLCLIQVGQECYGVQTICTRGRCAMVWARTACEPIVQARFCQARLRRTCAMDRHILRGAMVIEDLRWRWSSENGYVRQTPYGYSTALLRRSETRRQSQRTQPKR